MTGTQRGEAARRAYQQIRRSIMAGDLVPGSMLSEAELAASLGVSRTPVRTALGRLQEDGWVRIYPQRGALVRELTATEIREGAEVRHALETAGVRRALPTRLAELRDEAEASLAEQQAALDVDDFARFNELSQRFHRLFVEVGGNDTMLALYDRVAERQLLSTAGSARSITQNQQAVMAEHHTLFETAWARDWAGFAAALDVHQAVHAVSPGV